MAFVLKTLVDEDKKKNDDKKETSALRKLLTPTRTALYSPNTGALAGKCTSHLPRDAFSSSTVV